MIENSKSIEILNNGGENKICISQETIVELDKKKSDLRLNYIVKEVTQELLKNIDQIEILDCKTSKNVHDGKILDDILYFLKENPDCNFIFVTNDNILTFRAKKLNIQTQSFKDSNPYLSESQIYTGFIDSLTEEKINNCFWWENGELRHFTGGSDKVIKYENQIWKLRPRTPQQNAAFELLLNENLNIVSIQSTPGFGKTMMSLAAAFYWTFEKKKFKKIFVFKHHIDVGGEKLGYLPGPVQEKVSPYFRPIFDLAIKLHETREANRLFIDSKADILEPNPQVFEFLPINFIRGMNIENAFVLIDEIQDYSRQELKVILSRMGENVKVVCTGDVEQIDSVYLNKMNNGMNWLVKLCKGQKTYGHVVLKGKHSRGPIADLVREVGF